MNREEFYKRKPKLIGEDDLRKYSVLVPLLDKSGDIQLLFEKRSISLSQPGEICFPGGKMEKGESPKECAIRETSEELCIRSEKIEIIAHSDIYISPFNSIIYPLVGEIRDYNYTFSTDEVEEVITIPLEFFKNKEPEHYKNKIINKPPVEFPYEKINGGENYKWAQGTYDVYFYHYDDHVIWGMTARILHSTLQLFKDYNIF